MKLSRSYDALFYEVLASAGAWIPRGAQPRGLAACWPEIGDEYENRRVLMVVGRATNGFDPKFDLCDLRSSERRRKLLSDLRKFGEQPFDGRPLSWIQSPNYRRGGTVGSRSAFWRVTRALIRELEGADVALRADWATCVAWSNVAKVAPHSAGNPSPKLWLAQREACVAALRREVEELDPRIVLLLVGREWYADLVLRLGLQTQQRQGSKYVAHAARDGRRVWLCAERPERQPESAVVAELLRALEDMSAS